MTYYTPNSKPTIIDIYFIAFYKSNSHSHHLTSKYTVGVRIVFCFSLVTFSFVLITQLTDKKYVYTRITPTSVIKNNPYYSLSYIFTIWGLPFILMNSAHTIETI